MTGLVKRRGVVAQNMEHPEDLRRAADVARQLAMAPLQQIGACRDIVADIGLARCGRR